MEEVVKIKKYGNRRYYSSEEKSYINLSDIERLVLKGQKIQVIDADSEDDITSEVLTQILLDQGRAQHFPVELLENMIRMNEKALGSFWAPLMQQNIKLMAQMSEIALSNMKSFMNPLSKKSKNSNQTRGEKK